MYSIWFETFYELVHRNSFRWSYVAGFNTRSDTAHYSLGIIKSISVWFSHAGRLVQNLSDIMSWQLPQTSELIKISSGPPREGKLEFLPYTTTCYHMTEVLYLGHMIKPPWLAEWVNLELILLFGTSDRVELENDCFVKLKCWDAQLHKNTHVSH